MANTSRDILELARSVIEQHGERAVVFAAAELGRMVEFHDTAGALTWRNVLLAIEHGLQTDNALNRDAEPTGVAQAVRDSTLTCPHCNRKELERMPTDACLIFYDCKGCGERLKPRPGDCCVFCSYGTVPCPPVQRKKECCA